MQALARESDSYSLIHHLCWGVLLNHDPQRTRIFVVTEYAFYGDAGGHPDDQPCVLVAGFLATESQWLTFEPKWKSVQAKYSLGEVVHLTDFESRNRKNPQRGAILEALTEVIARNTTTSFSCIVDMKAYRKVNDAWTLEESMGAPYALACRGLARNINLWKAKHLTHDDKVLIFLEQGTKHQGDMEQAFLRDKLPVPQTLPKGHSCVQPADMLAWEIVHCQYYGEQRKSLRNLLGAYAHDESQHSTYDEAALMRTCAIMPPSTPLMLRKDVPKGAQFVYKSAPKRIRKRTIR